MGIRTTLAGLGGRKPIVGFTASLATAQVVIGEPGSRVVGNKPFLAGLGGRKERLGIT
jgi:hypothetical protein